MAVDLFDNWFDPIETEVRARAREFIEELIRGELDAVLVRPRYGRSRMAGSEERAGVAGHRHGSQTRSLTGTFGPVEIAVPRARLFTFTRLPPSQWRSARTINSMERLHEEFKRRIKTQTVLPSADTAAMLFWALLASGQINMRKVDGWQTLATKPIDQPIDLAT
jgi:transposase-like protein